MIDLGIVKPGSTLYIPFASYAGSTGAPSAMTGLATSDILVYKDGGTTERASASGYTLLDTDGLDFDGKTGINGVSISLADDTTAGFWAAGSRYWVVIGDVTVDSQTVRFIAATFTIGLPGAVLNTTIATLASQTSFTLTAGPAEDDALNGCVVYIHDVASAVQGGFAVVSDYTGSTKTVTLVAGTTFTAAASDNVMVMPPRLLPTVLGRTLDVSTGGEAGVDWANVGSQTTAVDLSGTNIKTNQKVDVETIKTQAVATTGAGTITFPGAATLASTTNITAGTIATVSGNVNGSVNSVTTGVSIANGAITTTTFGAGAIDAAAIAANAIGASELATDAAEEIADTILGRNVAGGSNTGRLVKEALYPLRNKVVIAAGTMTVYQTDDTTSSWTATVATTAGDPISSVDPS